jgi:phage tail-like protein
MAWPAAAATADLSSDDVTDRETAVPPALPTEVTNPFLTYNFLVKWDGQYVAAVTSVSGLTRRTQVVSFDAGGQPQSAVKIPGQTDYEPVRLARGITTNRAFEEWAAMTWCYPNTQQLGNEVALATFRKPMQIELHDQQGTLALRYNLYYCWPSEYTALPELDTDADTVALASMTIEHEGWDRDMSVVYPPTATRPGPRSAH